MSVRKQWIFKSILLSGSLKKTKQIKEQYTIIIYKYLFSVSRYFRSHQALEKLSVVRELG